MNKYAIVTFEYNNKRYLSVWYLIDREGQRWLVKDQERVKTATAVEVREYPNYEAAHAGIFGDYNYLLPENTNK